MRSYTEAGSMFGSIIAVVVAVVLFLITKIFLLALAAAVVVICLPVLFGGWKRKEKAVEEKAKAWAREIREWEVDQDRMRCGRPVKID